LEITIEPEVSEKLYGKKTLKHTLTENQHSLSDALIAFKPEIVIHLASYLTANDDFLTMKRLIDTNVFFFCRLLDALKNSGLKMFINTGTFAEYFKGDNRFDPSYLYAATKTASRSFLDYYSKAYKFKQTTVVPYTIYGGLDTQKKIIDLIYDSISSETPLDLSPGEQILDFIHIDDVTDFYLNLVECYTSLPEKSNFQLGTGTGTSLKQLARYIEEITNKKTNINWGGKLYRSTDVMYAVADLEMHKKYFLRKPDISLLQGLANFVSKRINDDI
jgi:nucleoside-diphosphate-sugar epimerase